MGARSAAARARIAGAARWTGVPTERNVSAISSSRASASSRRSAGPETAVQASFTWGSPQDLERPSSAKVSAGPPPATVATRAGSPRSGKSAKTSSAITARPSAAQYRETSSHSSCFR